MDKTSVSVKLVIYGDHFDLQSVSNRLNLTPTEQWEKGDLVEIKSIKGNYKLYDSKPLKRKDTTWCLATEFEQSYDISVQARKLLDIVGGKSDELLKLQKEENVGIHIMFVVYIYDNMRPAFVIEKDLIAFAYACNADISIDWYFYGSSDGFADE